MADVDVQCFKGLFLGGGLNVARALATEENLSLRLRCYMRKEGASRALQLLLDVKQAWGAAHADKNLILNVVRLRGES